jgi:hypothetical protein
VREFFKVLDSKGSNRVKIGKIKGSNAERFLVTWEPHSRKAYVHSDVWSEGQTREIMTRLGAKISEIDALIEQARKHEVG